jgi:glycosyltransferase involved in cell wall biosynthesis
MTQVKIVYISFDNVPAPKGATIHIAAFSQALAAAFSGVELVTVSPTCDTIDSYEIYPQVTHTMLPAVGDTLIHRILYFRRLLLTWLRGRRFKAVHIRSIFEGLPIAVNKKQYCDYLIFEVNGLPSIELKYRYPAVADDRVLLHKLRAQEQICLEAADLIVTPSSVTAKYLQTRGVGIHKIRVIPNGVDLDIFSYCRVGTAHLSQRLVGSTQPTALRLLYFGTLSPWQGVHLAVEALALLNQECCATLTVIGQARGYQIKTLKHLASKLGVVDKLTIFEPMSQQQLVEYIHATDFILAPLTANDRNLVQGCCPLKIIEGMATGIPVIASDLPVVRELGVDGEHFLLVKPDSAKAIREAVLRLYQDRELATQLAAHARQRIEQYYTWKLAGEALILAYMELGINLSITI